MTKVCQKCNKEFTKPYTCSKKEWEKRKFCSQSCANSVNLNGKLFKKGEVSLLKGKKRPNLAGKNHPKWNRQEKECKYCKKEFWCESYLFDTKKFCSKKCRKSWFNENSLLSVRDRVKKIKKYSDWRNAIFQRDNYTCQICGIRNKKGLGKTVELQIDHYPKTFAEIVRDNNIRSIDDAIDCKEMWDISKNRVLCRECHMKTDTWGIKNVFLMRKRSITSLLE